MDLPKETVDTLIKEFREQKDISNDRYLTGILDFFKWITTFDFAIIIWIGANIQKFGLYSKRLVVVSTYFYYFIYYYRHCNNSFNFRFVE